ncbi:hypothetical protein I79_008962 [Cricetulus griseus]|uniref:Uncharacterized protein n=1 Tax=Cricetulus griseus TaxID=10029 RepID=G3HEH8_CRIGR|nr:hypothetical protein I79_008962 [Cricetulus griseus]
MAQLHSRCLHFAVPHCPYPIWAPAAACGWTSPGPLSPTGLFSTPGRISGQGAPGPAGCECDIFLVLLGYRSLGYTKLLEALVNQQTKYECGQDSQPEGGRHGSSTTH